MPVIKFSRRIVKAGSDRIVNARRGVDHTGRQCCQPAAGRVVYVPRPTGTIKVRIPQKVWNGQHFDAQDLVRVSGPVSHENDGSILYVAVISKPKTQF
jgi:hypothetical protein